MTVPAQAAELALAARRAYADTLVRASANAPPALIEVLQQRLLKPALPREVRGWQDTLAALQQHGAAWQMGLIRRLRQAQREVQAPRAAPGGGASVVGLTLVADDTIEREINASRLALAVDADTQWQFTDLRTRMLALEGRQELPTHDLLRASTVARFWVEAWAESQLGHADWLQVHEAILAEFGHWLGVAYHDTNLWLIQRGVMPEVDLRPFIRRSTGVAVTAGLGASFLETTTRQMQGSGPVVGAPSAGAVTPSTQSRHGPGLAGTVGSEHAPTMGAGTRLSAAIHASTRPDTGPSTRSTASGHSISPTASGHSTGSQGAQSTGAAADGPLPSGSPANVQANDVLAQLQQVLRRHVPTLAAADKPSLAEAVPDREAPMRAEGLVKASPRLQAVIQRAQQALQRPPAASDASAGSGAMASSGALDEVRARSQAFKQVLKQAAATPEERATIEIVAMMFQSILQEERLPASVRVWFARLQMPVLRVAVGEPDFFATNDHPARALIDRMGGCVLGFDAAAEAVGEVLEREIKRVVQVVEAYPDTGRRVFQTVLTEFESFLSNFFAKENPASRASVSLAQQVEQRETLAIQFTIELRKMLADMPVDDALREFLFQVWADVLAVTAMRHGAQDEVTRTMKRAAADLIWSAGAKSSPEERAEVIRRLPLLLKTLRDGMGHAGLSQKKQDEHIRKLNNVLAAAFTAKAAPIPRERLEELKDRLQTLEAMLPSLSEIDLDEDMVRDLSGHEREGLEVVGEGGATPSPAMLAWARELAVGSWYKLSYRGRQDQVQLAWAGARHQLLLFVSTQGRAVLFPLHRLAAYLQAGHIQPAQEETLTVRATRDALAKLDQDPQALLRS
ncbi:DUF1631 family protein [Inhella sp.]|uniref:DUF1631 family protein n=1 Tax=Inhella sp. TaxID=1921806 RepID=UPI0035B47FFC